MPFEIFKVEIIPIKKPFFNEIPKKYLLGLIRVDEGIRYQNRLSRSMCARDEQKVKKAYIS
jgi:hypothetical protein